jgi:hypothetical protein
LTNREDVVLGDRGENAVAAGLLSASGDGVRLGVVLR